jgi:phenylacetate-CoA ligase
MSAVAPLLDDGERLSRAALEALQLERLKWTLAHAYEYAAHYRRAFDRAGVKPADLRSLADLPKFPFTTKDDLRAHYPFGFFAAPLSEVVRIHASSGTTGKPTVVGYTKRDIETWSGLMARSIRAAGGRPGMKAHVAYGYGLFTGGLGAHYGAEALGCTVIPMSGGQTEKQAQLILDFEPDILMATPSYALAILDEIRRIGADPKATSLKIGVFGAEPWTEEMRRELEAAFSIDAVDIYGLSEVMGPGVANECVETKDGLTLWEDHFYPEIVDPKSGAPLADGETGELVLTALTKQATPVIRYRTRDLTRLLPPTARPMRRIARIGGRADDMLIVRGVNVFPTQIEELILKEPALAPHYLIDIARPGRLDEMTIIVEAREGAGDEARAAARTSLQRHVKAMIGVSAAVDCVDPGALERSAGKARRVRDRRG